MRVHRELLTSLLAPGWPARGRRRVLAVAMLAAGVAAPAALVAYAIGSGRPRTALGLDPSFLAVVTVVMIAAGVARVASMIEVWVAAGRPRTWSARERVALVTAVAVLAVGGVVVGRVNAARVSIAPTFTGGGVLFDAAAPLATTPSTSSSAPATVATVATTTLPVLGAAPGSTLVVTGPSTTTTITTTTTTTTLPPPLPERPESGVDPAELVDVHTVLLLGGDAGPGRSGLRTDSMMLLSVHRPSGRASLVSIPRDLRRLLSPPGSALEARYPYGYTGIANAVYATVSSRSSLRDAYAVDGVRPGVVALAEAIGYSLDVTIHDYVLVDMQGFLDLVDALGGVTVDVRREIPMPGNVPGAPARYPDTIGPGLVEMDGTTALGYARSRYADNDYRRTERQRRLLAALARQVSIADVVADYPAIASAVGGTLRTSLGPDELVEMLGALGAEASVAESVGLVPPAFDMRRPDLDGMAKLVGRVHLLIVHGRPA